ncbi:hypothetical protein DFJ58DRAFT_908543 [Suillus subalutaceus]|uniref:uncharacterized protein n=1 Tax=Suillus subalutaceus TaxID=48586 RepID=UPI001B87A502|nr:uncharacterized protein DFJ58DRAFT_908543 [Suillus subalutaceus]KAG1836034.1 hypothetical protein DFJ58DRAFT_908543 [Suillus subalutaceus]
MILLLCTVLFCVPFVRASLPGLNDTHILALDAIDSPSCNTRSLWDILSSCGLTMFACTWTAIHPNIPGVDDWVILVTVRRLCLMVMAVSAPEVVVAFATLEFLSARHAAKKFGDAFGVQRAQPRSYCRAIPQKLVVMLRGKSRSLSDGWTLTHGFFACMGGFVLYVDGEPRATLTPNELLRFVREGSVKMPDITEADIEDRSKGDMLSKCIAILQLVWFVIQLIARYAQNLPVTLLELDTLGIAALACISYGFWLNKPKDIGRPYIVHWDSEATAPPPGDSLANKYYSHEHQSLKQLLVGPGQPIDSGSTASGLTAILSITTCVSGMVFGLIHCLGWNFVFPRHTEQTLWRVASSGMACSPLFLFFIGTMMILWDRLSLEYHILISDEVPSRLQNIQAILAPIFAFLFILGMCLYIFSRVTIIVLMFLSLRSLPAGAYDTVAWTKYIPHINL